MRFNPSHLLSLTWILATSGLLTGCGMFGTKNPPGSGSSNINATGCLNESTGLVSRYLDGTLTQTEWNKAFNCINTSLDFFTNFVRGSTVDSYTQDDMYTLITKFLITNGRVRPDLMKAVFNLKASLFGGTVRVITKDEIALLKNSLTRLRDITVELIPYLQLRHQQSVSYSELQEITPAFKRAGDQLADFINTLPTAPMSLNVITLLLSELTYTLNLPVIDQLTERTSMAKWLLFNTRRDAFEGQDWAQTFRYAFGLGGIALTFKIALGNDPNAPQGQLVTRLKDDYRFREFAWNSLLQAQPYLDEMVTKHGDSTPLPIFDHILDLLPADTLGSAPLPIVKATLRPVLLKLFQSNSQIGFDHNVVATLFELIGNSVCRLGALDRFYEQTGLNPDSVPATTMNHALDHYAESLTGIDAAKFSVIKTSLKMHAPMLNNNGSVKYQFNLGYSRVQQMEVLALEDAANFIHASFGSDLNNFEQSDIINFFATFQDILYAYSLVDPTVANFAQKRFTDLDLFTPISNGDGHASVPEIVEYALMLISSGQLEKQMRAEITLACPQDLGIDNMGVRWISAECFRHNFHERLDYWLTDFPRLKAYWLSLRPADQQKAMVWLEHGARRNGYNQTEFGSYDFQAMATVLYYTESLFTRFDNDGNEVLSKPEVKSAFSLFKILIQNQVKKIAGLTTDSHYLLEGIFSYIVRYRSMPVLKKLKSIAQFAWWLIIYDLPSTDFATDRMGVFNIVCQLAEPESTTQQQSTPTICAP